MFTLRITAYGFHFTDHCTQFYSIRNFLQYPDRKEKIYDNFVIYFHSFNKNSEKQLPSSTLEVTVIYPFSRCKISCARYSPRPLPS